MKKNLFLLWFPWRLDKSEAMYQLATQNQMEPQQLYEEFKHLFQSWKREVVAYSKCHKRKSTPMPQIIKREIEFDFLQLKNYLLIS